jgi:hypothetical protein
MKRSGPELDWLGRFSLQVTLKLMFDVAFQGGML